MFRILWAKKSLIVFLVLIIAFLPNAATRPAQMLTKTVLVAVGIDKNGDEYEVSGHMVVNTFKSASAADGGEDIKLVSASGETLNKAVEELGANNGAKVGLKHCHVLVIGSGLKNEDISPILKNFIVSGEMTNNSFLTYTNGTAKQLLEAAVKQEGVIQKALQFNKNKYKLQINMETFYKDYLMGRQSLMGLLDVENNNIINNQSVAVFKQGMFVSEIQK